MNNELLIGKNSQKIDKNAQIVTKKEGIPTGKETAPQNITVVLPAFNEEVSIGSIVLLTKHYSDNVIVIDDGQLNSVENKATWQFFCKITNLGRLSNLKFKIYNLFLLATHKNLTLNLPQNYGTVEYNSYRSIEYSITQSDQTT